MKPNLRQMAVGLKVLGRVLGTSRVSYCFEGRFAFALAAGWTLVFSPDDADRFRIEMCRAGRARATMWCLSTDTQRLAELAVAAHDEALSLVG